MYFLKYIIIANFALSLIGRNHCASIDYGSSFLDPSSFSSSPVLYPVPSSSKVVLGYYNSQGYPATVPPSTSSLASDALNKVEEKILHQSVEEFLAKKQKDKAILRENIEKTDKEVSQIKKAIHNRDPKDKKIYKDLIGWLKKKQKEGAVFRDEVKLLEDITILLAELEGAKFFAQERDLINPYMSIPSLQEYRGDFSSFDQSPYKTFARNYISNPSQMQLVYPKIKEEEFVNLDSKANSGNDNFKKDEVYKTQAEQINKAIAAVNHIEKVINFDPSSVYKLITKIKGLLQEGIAENENLVRKSEYLLSLQSDSYKKNLIPHPEMYKTQVEVSKYKSNLEESKRRLWDIKQMEWLITQIEAAKFLAGLKESSRSESEYIQKVKDAAQS